LKEKKALLKYFSLHKLSLLKHGINQKHLIFLQLLCAFGVTEILAHKIENIDSASMFILFCDLKRKDDPVVLLTRVLLNNLKLFR